MTRPKPSALINNAGVIPEAFHDLQPGVNCAVYQLSKHLDQTYDELAAAMALISQELYGDETVTPRVVLKWCEGQQLSCY